MQEYLIPFRWDVLKKESLDGFDWSSMIKLKSKDFLLKECEFEAKGTHSVDEMMKLIEVHAGEEHRTLKLSPETIMKIRGSLERSSGCLEHSPLFCA